MKMPRNIYMVGIGGIGMSALAQYLKHSGHKVVGIDREDSPTVRMLEEKGISVCVGHNECAVPQNVELLIYSDAVPSGNAQRTRGQSVGIPELSYFEALGAITKGRKTIAVAGTHGKTTTTGMLGKILAGAGKEPSVIVGSIVKDFQSNFLPGSNNLFVVEACEYRDHVLKLAPEILVITNVELDHTDYFPNLEALQATFRKAIERVPEHGYVVTNPSEVAIAALLHNVRARVIDYTTAEVPNLHMIGEFNRMNARAARAAARAAFPDIADATVDSALSSFEGSWRRFEYKGETPQGALVYDDYAHHPTAIRKTIEAARERFPGHKILVAFHPHLYSRTKSFLHEFASALSLADEAIVAPIYAAREAPDSAISNQSLANAAGNHIHALNSFDAIRDRLLEEREGTLIITMGAGDIYKVAEQIAGE